MDRPCAGASASVHNLIPPPPPPHPPPAPPPPAPPSLHTTTTDDIYREDIEFKDPSLTFRGQRNYRIIFWSLRFHARLLLKAAHVQVLRIWQPEDTVIK